MTCIPFDMEIGRLDPLARVRDRLADRRRRMRVTVRQARAIAIVFALGVGFHMMKWAGVLVL